VKSITKSDLVEQINKQYHSIAYKDVKQAVDILLEQISDALENGDRVEVRGFGSFSLSYKKPRNGRNPKTGDEVIVPAKFVPHFKVGKDLRDRVNK
jgi:integration host factor subunit beta